MKKQITTLLMLVAMCGVAQADLRIPGSVFEIDEIEEAKAKAAEDKEPLIFVYTDPGSS